MVLENLWKTGTLPKPRFSEISLMVISEYFSILFAYITTMDSIRSGAERPLTFLMSLERYCRSEVPENRFIHSERVQRIKEKRKEVMRRLDEKVQFEEMGPMEIER